MSKQDRPKQPPTQTAPAKPPADAWWNGIARKWLVMRDGEAVAVDPQPPPPVARAEAVPPATKVML